MSDEELEELARAAAEAVGPEWTFLHAHGNEEGWVESATDGKNIGTGYDGEWDARAGRFSAAFDPATALALLERVRRAEARVSALGDVARAVESMTADVAENGNCADCPYVSRERALELLAIIRDERP